MAGSERTGEREEDEVGDRSGIVILADYCEVLSFPPSETN